MPARGTHSGNNRVAQRWGQVCAGNIVVSFRGCGPDVSMQFHLGMQLSPDHQIAAFRARPWGSEYRARLHHVSPVRRRTHKPSSSGMSSLRDCSKQRSQRSGCVVDRDMRECYRGIECGACLQHGCRCRCRGKSTIGGIPIGLDAGGYCNLAIVLHWLPVGATSRQCGSQGYQRRIDVSTPRGHRSCLATAQHSSISSYSYYVDHGLFSARASYPIRR